MYRVLFAWFALLVSFGACAANESVMSLLDNRFRIDPTIDQITFVIYRAQNSDPVVLVRPDGKKYHAKDDNPNVRWYQESAMDIVSIDHPMPGPWQALGRVTPKNHIRLISKLQLTADTFPKRLYQSEQLKFTARLTSDGKPLALRDFLDRVNLRVTFTKYVADESQLKESMIPKPVVMGEFTDDGKGMDEKPGDGVFTVELPIDIEPGKYRARITSGNGVFLRALEQEVLVFPRPITTTFIQSRNKNQQHQFLVRAEKGMIEPGTLMASIEEHGPNNIVRHTQGQAAKEDLLVKMAMPYDGTLGKYSWQGTAFATDSVGQRALRFPIYKQSYSVVQQLDLNKAREMREQAEAEQKKLENEKRILEYRQAERKKHLLIIAIGNVVVILLAVVVWFVLRKLKAAREIVPEKQLSVKK